MTLPALQPDHLRRLLGMAEHRRATSAVTHECAGDGFAIRTVTVDANGRSVPATLLVPDQSNGAALLYCHAHGDRYDIGRSELLEGRPAIAEPLGPELARLGFTVVCADMPGFGERQAEGGEPALAKAALWHGETLMGRMLSDLMAAVDVLEDLPETDSQRIGALGLSMGATHAYWLAALDQRISAVAHVCAFSNIAPLIETGAHDLHGPYMTVPGLLAAGDMGDVAALIAPRPQFIASGADDPLTPPAALKPALATVREAYGKDGALTVLTETSVGHELTPAMRTELVTFLTETLAPGD